MGTIRTCDVSAPVQKSLLESARLNGAVSYFDLIHGLIKGGVGIRMSDIQDRIFSVPLNCHYLLLKPAAIDSHTALVLTLHGFGANPESMLQLTARLFDGQPVIASLQGPNQFFLGTDRREVGYRLRVIKTEMKLVIFDR